MTNQEIKLSATYIKKLASFPDAEDRISLYLDSLFATQPQKDTFNEPENSKSKAVSSLLYFTQKEINQIPKTFKKEFRTDGCTAHVRKRKCSKNGYTYDIRYNRNGYSICVTNKSLETAKLLFIEKLKNAKPVAKRVTHGSTLHDFTVYYFEKFRLPKVSKLTYDADWNRYKRYIQPIFGDKQFNSINADQCQALIDQLLSQG